MSPNPTETDPTDLGAAPPASPHSLIALLQELHGPATDGHGARAPLDSRQLAALAGFAATCLVAYGAVAGLFAGGDQMMVSAFKAPLVVGFALALTAPSLAVLTGLAGVAWSARRLLSALLAYAAGLALLLLTLLPVVWLFSVSSRNLASLVVLHVAVWSAAIGFSGRALRRFTGGYARGPLALWAWLLLFVSLQAATFLQPVLFREPGAALFPRPRQLFLEHFNAAVKVTLPETSPVTPPAESP